MITNERQYKITRTQAGRFRQALAHLEKNPTEGIHPTLVKAERDALASQLEDLDEAINAYERLRSSDVSVISVASFDELADGLIKARIAGGISQRELAERLGLKEQQIQRYESERYGSASYRRLQEIAKALGIRIRNDMLLPIKPHSMNDLIKKLRQVGLSRDFLFSRLLSPTDAAHASGEEMAEDNEALFARVGATLSRIFGWSLSDIFGAQPLAPPEIAAAEARFKMPARRSQTSTSVYSTYVNYLAMVVLNASQSLEKRVLSGDSKIVRSEIVERYGALTLSATLSYAWDIGIPVLPLRDTGHFHGACWRYKRRNIIVLKQNSTHQSRWNFDLLHECHHAAQRPESDYFELIESEETSEERRNSSEEIEASQFAGDVLLDGRAEELAQACVKVAKGSVGRLKRAVKDIAHSEGVEIGALANFLAYRLSRQNINWWGAANNLQGEDDDPWATTRDLFLMRFPFAIEDDFDRNLLNRALK